MSAHRRSSAGPAAKRARSRLASAATKRRRARLASAALAAAVLVSLCGCGEDFAPGVRAYEEGRFEDAARLFGEAAAAAGENASAELLYSRALSALRARDWLLAESEAEKAAARGGETFAALRDFLSGNTAFARCEAAEAAAGAGTEGPEAVFTYLDAALGHAMFASRSWQRAAASRLDWPEARRNVERALIRIEELKRKAADARQRMADQRRERIDVPVPLPEQAQPEEGGKVAEEETEVAPQRNELDDAALRRLLETLDEKEKEKKKLRRSLQRERADVERDW